mmetsp:Transcript_27835/g.57430  ORF Transcript_27835/g.57430 Transcript_27835/m.57430 type:complete len:201 (+) Transcript_27835:31-633(+)
MPCWRQKSSVDFHVIAVRLLHRLGELRPVLAVLLRDWPEALGHSALHAFQATHVHVGLLALHELPQLVRILSHLCLNIHLLTLSVLVLSADGVVIAEVVGILLLVDFVLIVVEQRLGVRNTHEEPGQALEVTAAPLAEETRHLCLESLGRTGLVVEQEPQVGSHRSNAGACGQHDDIGLGVLRQEHLGTRGARDENVVSW